uniref:uncharacterized protein LOC124046175 isoform X3 n=1 Tax=Oncorhynchus gorbuscha TaxID=8017 RepID=UPI001EAED83D|nr:uncharacterized protein LOC124046175 isoform X3 [Oncorhynchus gorbuscha]
MAWHSQRGQGRQSGGFSQRKYVPRRPLVQSNRSVCGENEVDQLLDLLSTLSEDRPPYLSVSDEVLDRHTSEPVLRPKNLSRNTDLTERGPTWSAKLGKLSHQGSEEKGSEVNLTDRDILVPIRLQGGASLTSGHPYGSIAGRGDGGNCVNWLGKWGRGRQQPVERECVSFVQKCNSGSLGSTFPGDAPFYPAVPDMLDRRQGEHGKPACPKQNENVSTFQDLLESSWTSASLHRSMLDLEIGLSVVDLGLLPQALNTSGDLALSPVNLGSPLDHESHGPRPSISCNAKMSCSIIHCHKGGRRCSTSKDGSSTSLYKANRETEFSELRLQSEIAKNAGQQSTNIHSPSVSVKAHIKPWREAERKAEKKTDVFAKADKKTDVFASTMRGSDFPSNMYFLPASLSQYSFSGRQNSTEVAYPEHNTKWSNEFSGQAKSDSVDTVHSFYPTLKGVEDLFEVPRVTTSNPAVSHSLLWEERLGITKNLGQITLSDRERAAHLKRSTPNASSQDNREGLSLLLHSHGRRTPGSTTPERQCQSDPLVTTHTGTLHTLTGGASGEFLGERDLSAVHQSLPTPIDAVEIHSPSLVETIEDSRWLALYRFRLQLRCFRTWDHQWRSHTRARLQHRRHFLRTGLSALRWAVVTRRAQTDTLARRTDALTLAHCFHRWRTCVGQMHCLNVSPGSVRGDIGVVCLLRRLTQPSNTLVLRTAYCAWRSHIQGMQLGRASLIHYHLTLLFKHWLVWRQAGVRLQAWALQAQRAALHWDHRQQSQAYALWRAAWVTARLATEQHRRVAQRWRERTHGARLQRVCVEAEQVLSRQILAVAFGRWHQEFARADCGHRLVQRWHDLLEWRRLQEAFTSWNRRVLVRRGALEIQERRQRAQLSHILRGWRGVAERRAACVCYCSERNDRMAAHTLQSWRRATALRSRHTRLLTHLLERRRTQALTLGTLTGNMRPSEAVTPRLYGGARLLTLEELCDNLQLQTSLHSWRREKSKLQLARLYCVARAREQVRLALRRWHELAWDSQACRMHRFRTRLAVLESSSSGFGSTSPLSLKLAVAEHNISTELSDWSNSSSSAQMDRGRPLLASSPLESLKTCFQVENHVDFAEGDQTFCLLHQSLPDHKSSPRLKGVMGSVVGRMLRPSLSVAFSQWRDYVRVGREQRRLMGLMADVRRRAMLGTALSLWRRHTQSLSTAAIQMETAILTFSVAHWRRVVAHQRSKVTLQRMADDFHTTAVLRSCFLTWEKKRTLIRVRPDPEARAQLVKRAVWLRRRGERQRTHSTFTLWTARLRQSQAVTAFYTHTTLTRVFTAWEQCVHSQREMSALARAHLHQRLLGQALAHWRESATRSLEFRRRGQERLALWARQNLQHWRDHTQRMCELRQLLGQYVESERRAAKKRALHTWVQATVNVRKAQDVHQQAFMSSCFGLLLRLLQRWHAQAQRSAREQSAIIAMKTQRHRRTLLAAFTTWKERFLYQQSLARAAARHWRQRALESKAASHRVTCLTWYSFTRWRWALHRRRDRCQRARVLGREWARRAKQSVDDQERATELLQQRQRRDVAERFYYWITAHQSSLTSLVFHNQTLCKRVFQGWQAYTGPALARKHKVARFHLGRARRLVALCFTHWRSELEQARNRLKVLEQRLKHIHFKLTAVTMNHWRTATRGCIALKHFNRGTIRQCFDHWRERTRTSRAVTILCVQRERRGAREVLLCWWKWTKESRCQRQMEEAVWLWLEGRRVTRAFQLWLRVHHRLQEASRLGRAHLMRRSFRVWRGVVTESLSTFQTAESRLRTHQTQSAFSVWRRRTVSHNLLSDLVQRTKSRQRSRLLRSSLHTWHQEVQLRKRLSLHLSQKYFACWVNRIGIRRIERKNQLEARLRECLWWWRLGVLLKRARRRLTQVLWVSWRDQTAAALLLKTLHTDRLQQGAWLIWRKRRIRTRVSETFAAQLDQALIAQVFNMWRQKHALRSTATDT